MRPKVKTMLANDAVAHVHFEAMAAKWLADGNQANERSDKKKAEECFRKAQYWHDRSTKARGWN